jgi:hypothetical protein
VAVNVTVRDIVNFPGGTAKTVTCDITQVVPVTGDPLEGDEIWVTSAVTTATASGGGSIENIFKNQMKRGFLKSSGLIPGTIVIPATARFKIAIDEDIGSGVDVTLTEGNNLLISDVAQDMENQIKAEAEIGGGGAKIGNLSYLNVQVRTNGNQFSIESGTVSTVFTGTGKSSVAIGAPDTGSDVRATLGFDIITSSETLAARQIAETSLASDYTAGDLLEVSSTAGFTAGSSLIVQDGTNSQVVVVSGAGVAGGLTAAQIRFTTESGVETNLSALYSTGSLVRLLHETDVSDPVSAITTVDGLYRFSIDSIVNQIDFNS